ncbi:MAG: 16S rRNA (uracil(1498)-N(3))-methyltransferase [Bacteroidales bacterium]|nr:16S rRNA (uracil(1498)-N(3))-methyltransferase [Bacteroidales bacterium]MDY2917786.1 16S rRNA (uracil(1498)-N(3))-methyltransferase [Muribaculaceae bacterium]
MIRFYAPEIQTTLTLPEADSGHAVRVLRLRAGDELQAVDGRGNLFRCRLLDENHRHAAVEILEMTPLPPVWDYQLTVLVAPTKNMDRMEWLVEKLTEIGINRFVPVRCARSERKEVKVERLRKIAVSAMKQSLKATLPAIDEMTPLKTALASVTAAQRFMGYCSDAVERRLLAPSLRPGSDVAILIGPEGDFSPEEVALAIDAGFVPVTMGDNRLRTETAALVAADTVHIINQLT